MGLAEYPRRATLGLALASAALITHGSGCRDGRAADRAADHAAPTAPARPRYDQTRELITLLAADLLRAHEVTGVSLALVDGDEVVWAAGFGHADLERNLPASPRTVYHVGSLAKPVTAAAVLQAVEAGQLRLDQTLAALLPGIELADGAHQQITLAQLLSHQSGLPSDWFVHDLSDQPPPWPAIVDEIRGLALAHPPGALSSYSNLGMTLAGAALAEAASDGRSYEQIVTESLLRPAGMRTAYFAGGPEPAPVRLPIAEAPAGLAAVERAAAYRGHQLRADPPLRMAPAAGLHASVLDLAAFAGMLLRGGRVGSRALLSPASVDALLRPHNDDIARDLDHRFGYGWLLDHERLDALGRVAWHGGRTQYHHARLIVLPDLGLAVAVAANSQTAGPVVETLAVETLIAAAFEKHGIEPPLPAAPGQPCSAPPDRVAAFTELHAGDYVTSTGLVAVGPREREGVIELAGRERLQLDADNGGTLASLPGARLIFVEHAGEHLMVVERDGARRPTAVRLGPPPPLSPAWRARLGAWQLARRAGEASVIADVRLEVSASGRLLLSLTGLLDDPPVPLELVLEPLDDRRARIAGRGRGQGSVVEVRGEGDDERLWWTGRELTRSR